MKFILLNGPPRCGKNTAASLLAESLPNCKVIAFAHYLKRFVHTIYFGEKGWSMDPDTLDAVKNDPQEILNGKSWRQIYIHYSEEVIKPLHGKDWFGRKFYESAQESGADIIVVPDSGFREEAEYVITRTSPRDTILFRLHRNGCTFAGDSRSYIDLHDYRIWTVDISNDRDLAHLSDRLLCWARPFSRGISFAA